MGTYPVRSKIDTSTSVCNNIVSVAGIPRFRYVTYSAGYATRPCDTRQAESPTQGRPINGVPG
jgi:hypothetical protein